MGKEKIYFKGEMVDADQLKIPADNRSFRYGDGFFETIRCMEGIPLWLEHHYERIITSAAQLKINLPDFTLEMLNDQIKKLLLFNAHLEGARVRVSFFRNEGGLYRPSDNRGSYFIESSELDQLAYQLNKNGIKTGFYSIIKKSNNSISRIKSSSALLYIMASLYGKDNGWDDVIIINDEDHICEASSSNIFMVERGNILTPSLDQGPVDGVMRKIILDIALQKGFKVMECAIKPNDLLKADEVFITNVIRGVQWLKGIGSKRYYHDLAGQFCTYLEGSAKEYVGRKKL
jgi:branched-chain amino acid aminotransferase